MAVAQWRHTIVLAVFTHDALSLFENYSFEIRQVFLNCGYDANSSEFALNRCQELYPSLIPLIWPIDANADVDSQHQS
jgi:hypothetical protein